MGRSSQRWRTPGQGLGERPDPVRHERRLAAVLAGLTSISIVLVHRFTWGDRVVESAVFAVALLSILAVHELGHRVVAARHELAVSLPLFLPAPFFVGTLGAIIRIHGTPRTRTALLRTGAAGPLAGLAAIVAVLGIRALLVDPPSTGRVLSEPLLMTVLGPAELSTSDPLAFAAWVGCLVTALNLLPIGQLDGGHVVRALAPSSARLVGWGTLAVLLLGGLVWWGWSLWALVLLAMGARHPIRVADVDEPVDRASVFLAVGCAAGWLLCFTPVPW